MVFGFVYQLVTLILSFVSRSVFIDVLGAEYLGMNGIFSDVLRLLSMADLGFSLAMSYSFYKPLAENDHDKIASLIAFYKKVYNIIAISVTAIGLLLIPFLRFIIKTEQEIPNLEIYYLFALAGVVMSYLFVYKTTLLTADQKNYKVVKVRTAANLIKTVLEVTTLLLFRNYILYLAIDLVVGFLNNYYATHIAVKEFPYIANTKNAKRLSKDEQKSIFKGLGSVFLYKLSTILYNFTDNILISMITGTIMVGYYSNYSLLSTKLLLAEQIVFSAMTASVGNLIVKEKEEKRLQVFNTMQSVSYIFCGIITTVFALMSSDVILVWLGPEFKLPLLVVIAVSINTYFSCVLQPLWIFRDATGIYRKTKYVMFAGAVLNIILSIILGLKIGLAGIIFASAISKICTYFWYEPKLLFKEYFGKSARDYFFGLLINFALIVALSCGIYYYSRSIQPSNWLELILKGSVIGIITTIVFLVAYSRTDGAKDIVLRAKRMLKLS
jgi:O-antigen/teichoic acid export membrane protein